MCSPDLYILENVWEVIAAKFCEGDRHYLAIFDAWENTFHLTSETSWYYVCPAEFLRLSNLTADLQNIK